MRTGSGARTVGAMRLSLTPPSRKRYAVAAAVGVVAGVISGLVKLGWEVPLPPRSPDRQDPDPPQMLLEQLGVPARGTHAVCRYNGNEVPYVSLLAHFGFSVGVSTLYTVAAERYPRITLGQGTAYGLGTWAVLHLVLLPATRTIPAAWRQPWQEHLSEAAGHAVWMWAAELTRRGLHDRPVHRPGLMAAAALPGRRGTRRVPSAAGEGR